MGLPPRTGGEEVEDGEVGKEVSAVTMEMSSASASSELDCL